MIDHDLLAALLEPYRTITREEVVRQTIYTFHALNAERWRVGRCFLAGDAAHMMPPFAGQGMNSGIRGRRQPVVEALDGGRWHSARVCTGELRARAAAAHPTHDRTLRETRSNRDEHELVPARLRDAAVRALNVVPPARRWLAQMRFRPRPHYASGTRHHHHGRHESATRADVSPQPLVLDASGRIVPLDSVLGAGYCVLVIDPPTREIDSRLASLASTVSGYGAIAAARGQAPMAGERVVVGDGRRLSSRVRAFEGKGTARSAGSLRSCDLRPG